MRARVAVLLLLIGVAVGLPRVAAAEKVKTNQSTKLYARPGEQAPIVIKVKEGQMMTVLAREGRWLKVRVQGRTGYVPRSKVDEPEGEQIARNTRRRAFVDGRSTKRGFGGGEGPDDRVGADATGVTGTAAGDDDDDAVKPVPKGKPAAKGDDDDDDAKPPKTKPAPKGKPAAKGDDDDDDAKPTPPKTKPAPKGKPAAKGDDDDDDAKPTPPKTKPAPKGKPAAKGDDDDDETPQPKGKPVAKGKPPKGKPAGDDDDDDKGADQDHDKDSGKGRDKDKDHDKDADAEPKTDERAIAHVSEKTSVHDDPDKASGEAFIARPKDKLYVGEVSGKYTFVETDEGDAGYVLTSKLDVALGPTLTGRQIEGTVGLGATIVGQAIHTIGGTGSSDNTTLSSTTATFAIGGTILYPYKAKFVLGGELAYDIGKSIVALGRPGMPSTGFTLHQFNLRAMAGYDFHNRYGMILYGRLGLHYQVFKVADVEDLMDKNTADVPSESYFAPTVGVALDVPHITPKIGARVNLDAVLLGSIVSQTKNLEDGSTPTASSVFFGGRFVYHLMTNLDVLAIYELNYGSFDFGRPLTDSQRVHTGSDTSRTDLYNTITFGVARDF